MGADSSKKADSDPTYAPSGDIIYGNKTQNWQKILGDLVKGDKVLGDKIIQYNFKALPDDAQRQKPLTAVEKQPYLPDRPFSPLEWPIFAGREQEINDILRYLVDDHRQTVVLYGLADVGKTSLIAAGIIPALYVNNALHAILQDYGRPTHTLHRELQARAAGQDLYPDKESSPAEIIQQLITATGRRIVLILDQFERAFMPDVNSAARHELRQEIHQIIDQIPQDQCHILISIRKDILVDLYAQWRDLLLDLGTTSLELQGLDYQEAQQAIERPAELSHEDQERPNFYFDSDHDIIEQFLLPDLDRLSSQDDGRILPADLQIVCYRLYEAAQKKKIPTIDEQLYWQISNNKGAIYILDDHFRQLLARVSEPAQKLVLPISRAMLADLDNFWSTAESLAISGTNTAEISTAMEEMVRAGILITHKTDNQYSFAFASNSISNAAGRAAGPEFEKNLEAKKQLNAIWRAWIVYDALANRGQLRLIQKHKPEYDPLKSLLLLRSSVAQAMPVEPWLMQLKMPDARQLLQRIENMRPEDAGQKGAKIDRHRAEGLLGILDDKLPQPPPDFSVGPITWTAVAHHDSPVVRETAILALMAAYEQVTGENQHQQRDALVRVDDLWHKNVIDRGRMAELVGTLSAANEHIAAKNKQRPLSDRLAIWFWRFRRLFSRDRAYIWSLTAGGALGAGLFLALWRAFLAIFITKRSGEFFYVNFPAGFLLGGALTLGVLLTNFVRLKVRDKDGKMIGKRPLLPALLLGALFFSLMHIFVSTLVLPELVTNWLSHLMALPAGAALAFAIYDQPMAGWRQRTSQWLLRFSTVGVVFALIQTFFIFYDDKAYSLITTWGGYFFKQEWQHNVGGALFARILEVDRWFHYFAVIDSALAGIVLALGIVTGVLLAARWYMNWQSLKIRAGE